MANYSKFDEVMNNLITSVKIEDFSGEALKNFLEHKDVFWDGLLQYLQNEKDKAPFNNQYGIRESMFIPDIKEGDKIKKLESVVEFINNNADLCDSFLDECLKASTSNPQEHWNPTFAQLLGFYRKYFIDHGEIDSTNITVDDILKANAGNSFNETKPWVIPWNSMDNHEITYEQKKEELIPFYSSHNKLKMKTTPVHTFALVYFTHVERGGEVYEFSETDLDILTKAADNFKRSVEHFTDNNVIIQYDILKYDTEDNPIVMSGPGGEHENIIRLDDIPQEIIDNIIYHYDNFFVFQGLDAKGQMGSTMYNYIVNEFGYTSFGMLENNISNIHDGEIYNPCEIYGDGYNYPVIPLAAVMMHEWIHVLEGYRSLKINFPDGHGYTDEPNLHHTYRWEHVYDEEKNPYIIETNSTSIHDDLMNYYYAVLRGTLYDETTQEEVGMIPYLWDITPLKIHNEDTYTVPYNYSTVRANDKIKRVLNDERFLQFTHKLFDKYIRLLMPEYQRVVEVEDLNRNFWVIGQVLTGLLAFLFDEDSPLNDIFEGLLDEIAQLWENLLYLWVAFALISQEINNDVQVLVIPVNNDDLRPYIKFDDFQETTELPEDFLETVFADKMYYLKDIYNKSTVVIIPEVRQCNYLKNYYAKVTYPGVIIYNRKYSQGVSTLLHHNASDESLEIEEAKKLVFYPIKLDINDSYRPFCVDMSNGVSQIGQKTLGLEVMGVYEKTPNYNFNAAYTSTNGIANVGYVGAIRTIFSANNQGNSPIIFTDGEITGIKLKAECIDVARELLDLSGDSGKLIMSATLELNNNAQAVIGTTTFNERRVPSFTEKKKIIKGWYRGEVVSYYHITKPEFTITVNKQWKNINPTTPAGEKVIVNITGKDSLGIETRTIKRELLAPAQDDGESFDVNVAAYSNSGRLIEYKITEDTLGNQFWEQSGTNTSINFESLNKITTLINTWNGVEFNGTPIPISKNYGATGSQGTDCQEYQTLEAFLAALDEDVEQTRWKEWVQDAVENGIGSYQPLPDNTVGFYYAHFHYYDGTNSQLEVTPYVTMVIKNGDSTDYYSFKYKVIDEEGGIHQSTGIPYPYMSSVYSGNVAESTKRLCQWSSSSDTSAVNVTINTPRTAVVSGHVTKGNCIYGYGTRRDGDIPSGAQDGIKLEFEQGKPQLYNYLILGYDRACAGVDATDDFEDDRLVETPTRVRALFPYYYKCEITQGAQLNGTPGEITATIQYNKKTADESYGLTLNGDFATGTYSWETDIDKRKYSYVDSGHPNEPNLTNWAQLAMGKIEAPFLSRKNPLLYQGGGEE